MNSKVYKMCSVPLCINTSINTPNKVFVYVPRNKTTRYKWLKLARRSPKDFDLNTNVYFCEDHFDLPNDMENYMQYHLMGSVTKVVMKPGCLPHKFECQPDRKRQSTDTITRSYMLKKQKTTLLEECEKQLQESSMVTEQLEEFTPGTSDQPCLEEAHEVISISTMVDKSTQVNVTKKFRSKASQTESIMVNEMTSPMRPYLHSVSTSPLKICHNKSSLRPQVNLLNRILEEVEQSDCDTAYVPSLTSPSTKSLQIESASSECSELVEHDKKLDNLVVLECTLMKITRNPRSYMGISQSCYYLIDLIQEQKNIPCNHILLCLQKIRLNHSFRELADDFAIDTTYASKIFFKNIPIIASVLRPFIVKLDSKMINRNLPMGFRHKYNKVTCIIDCMEIEVQKPSKALNQALTWSEYKKGNTIKYLVSSTPNGLVNYISPGFGGRITDTCIVESCDFKDCMQQGMFVMADRGFKHVEVDLRKMGVLLVRPPSVVAKAKLTKTEARQTKQIASLRIHIERVIRRLREFNMLKPHACLNLKLVKVLDDVLTIACGLINLQDSLIK